MSEEKKQEEINIDKRESRRKRRMRNQVLAYLVIILLIIALATGIVLGIRFLSELADKNAAVSQQQAVENLLQTEGSLETPDENPEYEPEAVELTFEQKLDQVVNAAIEVMPIEDKVAGLFFVSSDVLVAEAEDTEDDSVMREPLTKYAVGGILWENDSITDGEAFKGLLQDASLYSKYPIFLAVTEEGGDSSPVACINLGEKADGAAAIGALGKAENAYRAGTAIGEYLAAAGVNMNFAPSAVLDGTDVNSYGDTPDLVAGLACEMVRGLTEKKITSCAKYFPGLPMVSDDEADDENKAGAVAKTEAEFREKEFVVYQKLIEQGVPAIMVSHLSSLAFGEENVPCSLSEHVVSDLLRSELGYKGLVITDALNKEEVTEYYSAKEAAVAALRAGCDMIMMPENFAEAYEGLLEAVKSGVIAEARIDNALKRIYRIKFADRVE